MLRRSAHLLLLTSALVLGNGVAVRPAQAKWVCTAPDMVQYLHICWGMTPVPTFDAATFAQETANLLQNIEKTTKLLTQLPVEIAKLTNLTNLLKLAGNPGDEKGSSTGLGQMKAVFDVLGKDGPASFLKSLLGGGGSSASLPMIEKQVQSKLPQAMAGVDHSNLTQVTAKADQLFSFGGADPSTASQRRSLIATEATDAQAASSIAKSNLEGSEKVLKELEEAVKNAKSVREDWQANTKARLVLLEAINTRITLMARINATTATSTLAQAGDDANRSGSK